MSESPVEDASPGRTGSLDKHARGVSFVFLLVVLAEAIRVPADLWVRDRSGDIFEFDLYQRATLAFNYFELGPIRRGLGGSIVHLLGRDLLVGSTVFFYATAAAVVIGTSILFARLNLPLPSRVPFIVVAAAIMCRWAEDIGRSDMAIAAILVAATLALQHRRPVLAALAIGMSLFIHELGFIFGLPLLAVLFLRHCGLPVDASTRWKVLLVLALAGGIYLLMGTLPVASLQDTVRIVRDKLPPSDNVDWAIFIAVSGARGLALNLCQNRIDPSYPVHVAGGLLLILLTGWALERGSKHEWLAIAVAAVLPFLFLCVIANDMARWAGLACFNLWLVAVSSDAPLRPSAVSRLLPVVAAFAVLVFMEADVDRSDTLIHKPSPLLERAVRYFTHAPTTRFAEVLERCDPTWRSLLDDPARR